jgi:hypothetical protein
MYNSKWYNPQEREESLRKQRFAMLMQMKERDARKPPRNTNCDGDIAKRRDHS